MIKTNKIILLGAPGTGKGTLAKNLEKYGYKQISTGDLFRNKINENSEEAKQIQLLLNKGELIPDEITNNLAKDEILKLTKEGINIILDGYPRTIDQAKYLDKICQLDYVVLLEVNQQVLFDRITGRMNCKQCGKIYNEHTNPPKQKEICDDCNIPLIRRRDDNKDAFKIRMNEYNNKTKPLIDFYKKSTSTKFVIIKQKADDSIDAITNKVLAALK